MERVYTRRNWENEPSIQTPINATNLNAMDSALYTIDGRVVGFDTTKANQSDLLECVKQIDYNTTTGVFTFTWQNGTTKTVDLNIEKIPVSFSMSPSGVITMTTSDGTQYTADVGALIKTYTFTDSDVIDFTVTTDASGNKTVTANIVDGSITGDKLQPNYLADCIEAKNDAESASNSADGFKDAAEAWANGKIDGVPVPSTHPAYHNNAEYYKDMANPTQLSALTDVNLNNPTNRQALVYDTASGKWINGSGGLLPQMVITTEDGSTVTISKDGETITATSIGSGKYYAEIPEFGEWTVSASKGSQSATRVINVDTVKIYDVNASYFTAYINVTAPSGSSVTVVNGSETYTKATAPYNFEVHSAGTWVVTATKTDASKSKNVVISSDGQTVTTSIAFASITVTYPEEMEFETITATDGTRTYTRVASGTVVFDIANYGEWVVSCMGVSVTVNVTADIDYPIELKSGFDVQEWLQAGSVSGTYASLAEVLADEKALRQLFTKHASVDYLVECCSSDLDESVGTIIANDLCAKWINLRDYALDSLYANTYIASAMDEADKYFYGELSLQNIVPIMTSATQPSGTVFASSNESGYDAYHAFDGVNANSWQASSGRVVGEYIGYTFTSAKKISGITIYARNNSTTGAPKTFKIQGSNDNFTTVGYESEVLTFTNAETQNANETITFNSNGAYTSWRLLIVTGTRSDWVLIQELQFLAYTPKGNVPIMTSNSAPYGVASASSVWSTFDAWRAFNGTNTDTYDCWATANTSGTIQYGFINPVCVKRLSIRNRITEDVGTPIHFSLEGSNDNSSWSQIKSFITTDFTHNALSTFYADENTNYYMYYRLNMADSHASSGLNIAQLQFYGRELKVSIPIMTSDTLPYGKAESYIDFADAFRAFDNNSSSSASQNSRKIPASFGYDFGYDVVCKFVHLIPVIPRNTSPDYCRVKNFKIQGYDGSSWVDVLTDIYNHFSDDGQRFVVDNNTPYKKYRIYIIDDYSNQYNIGVLTLQFYGLDYSEHEERHWIYDHGVEVETVGLDVGSSNDGNELVLQASSSDGNGASSPLINMTDYNIVRFVLGNKILFDSGNDGAYIGIGTELNGNDGANAYSSGYSRIKNMDIPRNCYHSVTNISENKSATIVATHKSSANECVTVTEWWLE